MAGFCADEYGCLGQLYINVADFPLNCPAWDVNNLQTLWIEHAVRTDEVTLPTAPGRRSYPSRLDQSDYEMTLYVNGEADKDGVAWADPWDGLFQNLQSLWANVFAPVSTGDGTRPATLILPGGGVMEADVKVSPLRALAEIEDPFLATYRFTLTVPAGRFNYPGS